MGKSIVKAAVNNAILDPLSGFDMDVYVQDQATGKQLIVGRFTSFQFTMRNATEPYMEFNQRIARLLDGDLQFGWVLERGMVDVRFLEATFGYNSMSRELRINRSPRFQITVEFNAPELHAASTSSGASLQESLDLRTNNIGSVDGRNYAARAAKGRYRLVYAKTDTFTLGAMAGRSVIANRWEGLCEGVYYSDSTEIDPGSALNDTGAPGGAEGVGVSGVNRILTTPSVADAIGSKLPSSWDAWNPNDFDGSN